MIRQEVGASGSFQQQPTRDDELWGPGDPVDNVDPGHKLKEEIHGFLNALWHIDSVL